MSQKTKTASHEPLVHVVRREDASLGRNIWVRVAALFAAFATGALLILALGENPFAVYAQMLTGAVGTKTALIETVRKAIPLLIVTLGIIIAFKMKFWNIGGEGQVCLGAIAASYFALYQYENIPQPWLFILMFLAGALAGGIWGRDSSVFQIPVWHQRDAVYADAQLYRRIYHSVPSRGAVDEPGQHRFPADRSIRQRCAAAKGVRRAHRLDCGAHPGGVGADLPHQDQAWL